MPHSRSVAGVLLATMALAGCGSTPADPRTQPPLVRAATAGAAAENDRTFTGIVSARVQSDLGFRVAGKIIERLVDTGQTVRKGQILMRIDRTDFTLQTDARGGAVASARARAVQTAADERRYRDLVAAGAVSASTYDQIKAAAEAAKADLDAAQAQARIATNEADYSVLRADADGVVVEKLGEPGQVVAAGQTVIRLAHAGPREALVSLPETLRPAIGSSATATMFQSGTSSPARLRELSDAADPQTRTYAARYVLTGAAASAPIGSTVSVTVAPAGGAAPASDSRREQIPLAAIYDGGKGPGVWVIDPRSSQVHWRPVTLVALGDETAMITGLAPGQRFVALGAHMLHENERVRVATQAVAAK